MRLCCGVMNGQIWDAVLQAAPERETGAAPMVVLSNEEILSPADAEFAEFTIVEATDGERDALKQAGYSMADWDPAQWLGCPTCHAEDAEVGDRSVGAAESEL